MMMMSSQVLLCFLLLLLLLLLVVVVVDRPRLRQPSKATSLWQRQLVVVVEIRNRSWSIAMSTPLLERDRDRVIVTKEEEEEVANGRKRTKSKVRERLSDQRSGEEVEEVLAMPRDRFQELVEERTSKELPQFATESHSSRRPPELVLRALESSRQIGPSSHCRASSLSSSWESLLSIWEGETIPKQSLEQTRNWKQRSESTTGPV